MSIRLYLWGKRPLYLLHRRMGGLQSTSGCCRKAKNLSSLLRIKPQFLGCLVCSHKKTHTHARARTCTHTTHTTQHIHKHRTHARKCKCTHTPHVPKRTCMHTCAHTHTITHTHSYTHTHTHAHVRTCTTHACTHLPLFHFRKKWVGVSMPLPGYLPQKRNQVPIVLGGT